MKLTVVVNGYNNFVFRFDTGICDYCLPPENPGGRSRTSTAGLSGLHRYNNECRKEFFVAQTHTREVYAKCNLILAAWCDAGEYTLRHKRLWFTANHPIEAQHYRGSCARGKPPNRRLTSLFRPNRHHWDDY